MGVNIVNANSNTLLSGTASDDTIRNGGYDKKGKWHYGGSKVTINAGAGSDYISNRGSDAENVLITGQAGDDSIENYWGSKVKIYGGAGNDSIQNCWGSKVKIYGGAGNDKIENYDGSKVTIDGGAGNDYISNQACWSAKINAGAGNDSIYNGYSGDYVTITGGAGDDSIYNSDGWYATINAGGGNDSIQNDGSYVTIDADAGNDYVSIHIYSKNNVIKYAKGDGNDTIVGFNSNDILHITKGKYKTSVSENNVIVTVGTGKITLKDAKGQQISIKNSSGKVTTKTYSNNIAELFAENNFATADNISDIVENNLTATDYKFETQNFDSLTENNFVTFTK